MKSNRINKFCQNKSANGLTFVEVLVSVVVIVILAAVFLPLLAKSKSRSARINCVSSLKLVGLSMRMWSNDHSDKFPWKISTNEGGTMEFANTTTVFVHFLAASNELTSPKVLTCQNDEKRTRVASWDQLANDARHISYFVGLDADEAKPQSILSGDRNLTTNGRPAMGSVAITRAMAMGWTGTIHTNAGNVGFGDGSARRFLAMELQTPLQSALTNLGVDSIRLVIP